MARYEGFAKRIRHEIETLAQSRNLDSQDVAIIGKIVNLTLRAHPRPSQSTVRFRIVEEVVRSFCDVRMTKREVIDTRTNESRTVNFLTIMPKVSGVKGKDVVAVHCDETDE